MSTPKPIASVLVSPSELRPSRSEMGDYLRGPAGILIATIAANILVGVAFLYMRAPPEAAGSNHVISSSSPGSDEEVIGRLEAYAKSVGADKPATPATAAGKPLPDVDTMISRLAARLQTKPDDLEGWRMLGWSYFNTGRYEEAASAYEKAVGLDQSSAELKAAYEEAKAKVLASANSEASPTLQTGAIDKHGDAPVVATAAKSEAAPPHARDAAIRSLADNLADRLKTAPQDADGWTLLMRSRAVLGEREGAATAFLAALEAFKGDAAVSGKITDAAIELGLNSK